MYPVAGRIHHGIFAQTAIERVVHNALANEVIRCMVTCGLNGGASRSRIRSDAMWKYINVRPPFIFIEQSIDCRTLWAASHLVPFSRQRR